VTVAIVSSDKGRQIACVRPVRLGTRGHSLVAFSAVL